MICLYNELYPERHKCKVCGKELPYAYPDDICYSCEDKKSKVPRTDII